MENLRLLCPKCNLSRKKVFSYDEILDFSRNSPQLAATCGEPPQSAALIQSNPIQSESESEGDTRTRETPARHKYGQYANVLLSDEDMSKLQGEFPTDWEARIERLSEYMAYKGVSYKSHLATIRAWARKDAQQQSQQPTQKEESFAELAARMAQKEVR